ncbi:MAG TPA: hypothetical protein VIR63_02185 [Pontiella sp.]
MNAITLMLIVLCLILSGHYVSQKALLNRGWESENPEPYINRLMLNGAVLIVVAVIALLIAIDPYGLFGILIFIEGAVCITFGRKLKRK